MEQNNEKTLNPFVRIRGVKGKWDEIIDKLEQRGAIYISDECETQEYVDKWIYCDPTGTIRFMTDEEAKNNKYFLDNYEDITLWKAKPDEGFYYLNSFGDVCYAIEREICESNLLYHFGNYFSSREEAESYAKKIKDVLKDRI